MTEHQHAQHDADVDFGHMLTQEFWDDRYGSAEQIWSGKPNAQLITQAASLRPGEALEVGCGEGADAIWLAAQGWTVTGVDVSEVALKRAAGHAAARGDHVADRISWQREDALTWAPAPDSFDLVCAQFMHMPGPELESLHRRLTAAVRPGGTFLIVLHCPDDVRKQMAPPSAFPPAAQLAATLDPARWDVIVAEAFERMGTDPDGQPMMMRDTVLRAVRRA